LSSKVEEETGSAEEQPASNKLYGCTAKREGLISPSFLCMQVTYYG